MNIVNNRVTENPIIGVHIGLEGSQWFLYVSAYVTGSVHTFKTALLS